MKRIYITGVPVTGKSSICKELNKRGIASIDISMANPNLDCYWQNKETNERVEYNPDVDIEWYKLHGRVCDTNILKNYLDKHQEIMVVTGVASNQDEYLNLFDKIILLQCKEENFLNRMENRETNPFGKKLNEREHVKGWSKDFEIQLLSQCAIPINNDGDISQTVDKIIEMLQ